MEGFGGRRRFSSFLGRERALQEVDDLLGEHRLVTIAGPGGAGKTRLAVELSAERRGVVMVLLEDVHDPLLVSEAVHRAVLPDAPTVGDPEQAVAAALRGHGLLVLDNCEHVVGAAADLCVGLLERVRGLRVLATSRAPLGIDGEVVWRIPPIEPDVAEQLLIDRARAVRPGYEPVGLERAAVSDLCLRLEGSPLAIELAGARLRLVSARESVRALSDRLEGLGDARRGVPERQRTLRASIEWSHELLERRERVLLRRLSVFVGGCTLDLVQSVATGEELGREDAMEALAALVDHSLVVADHGATTRFRLSESLRQYAVERLEEANETQVVHERHLAAMLALAQGHGPSARLDPAARGLLLAEEGNLRAALEYALRHDVDAGAALVCALAELWLTTGASEARMALRRRVAVAAGHSHPLRPLMLSHEAFAAFFFADQDLARRESEAALEAAGTAADPEALARSSIALATVLTPVDPHRSRELLARARAARQHVNLPALEHDALRAMSMVAMMEDDAAGARAVMSDWAQLLERHPGQWWEAPYRRHQAVLARRRGQDEKARELLGDSLAAAASTGTAGGRSLALAELARLEIARGQVDPAEQLAAQAADWDERDGTAVVLPRLHELRAAIAMARDRPEQALAHVQSAVEASGDQRAGNWQWQILGTQGLALLLTGDLPGARGSAARLISLADRFAGNPRLASEGHHLAGCCALEAGDPVAARAALHEALALRYRHDLRPGVEDTIEALGEVAAALGAHEEAARLLGAAGAARREAGRVRHPPRTEHWTAFQKRLRQTLGRSMFATASAQGAAQTLDQAVAYARRSRGERRRPPRGWASLTPAEARVADLAARGLTNAEIAAGLFVTPNTTKTHLSRVFAKLGVSNRTALAKVTAEQHHPPVMTDHPVR